MIAPGLRKECEAWAPGSNCASPLTSVRSRLWPNLTAILLVVGVMDLRAMAVVTAAITVERLAPAGERVARALGAVVVGAGMFLIAQTAGLG